VAGPTIVERDARVPADSGAFRSGRRAIQALRLAGVDLQDVLLVAGVVFEEIAAVCIWWPAALILAGVFCLFFAYQIERSKAKTHGHPDA